MSQKKRRLRFVSNSYYKRILLLSCSAIILVGFLLLLGIYTISDHYTKENISAFESKKTHKAAAQLDDTLTQMASFSYYLCDTEIFPFQASSENTGFWNQKKLYNYINAYMLSSQHIYSVELNGPTLDLKVGPSLEDTSTVLIGKYRNCTLHIPETPKHPYCLELLYTSEATNRTVTVYTASSHMVEMFLEEDVFVIDSEGVILLTHDLSLQGKNLKTLYPDISISTPKSTEDFYIDSESIGNSGLSAITLTPKAKYTQQFTLNLIISIGIALVIMSLALVLVIRLISSIYKPIRNIADTFKYHLQTFDSDFEDEIAYINTSIEKTLHENQQLIDDKAMSISQIKQAQAQAVYSQISPHFIYNTLDNIKWISVDKLGIENDIVTSIMLLNNIIQEALHHNNMITTIENEIEITHNYIQLMLLRYRNSFDVIVDIEADIKQAPIIKLSLQPLIENSIMHSFNPNRKDQYIRIQAKRIVSNVNMNDENTDICITITDNGSGISPQKLKNLMADLHSDEPVEHHVGLKNVHLRYKLLYGDNYGIRAIESNSKGTTIQLLLPPP